MKKTAFTLAEVLITLVIIGVIAAITVPTLMNNYRKQQYVSGLKKAYATVENGFKLYVANQGGTGIQDTAMWQAVAEYFTSGTGFDTFQKEFDKVFSSTQNKLIIDTNDETATKYKYLKSGVDPHALVGIQENLNDGSILYILPSLDNRALYYATSEEELKQKGAKYTTFYGEIYIDINGEAKPNTIGRDTFYFALTAEGALVPGGSKQYNLIRWNSDYISWQDSTTMDYSCRTDGEYGSDGRGCVARIIDEGWEMKY